MTLQSLIGFLSLLKPEVFQPAAEIPARFVFVLPHASAVRLVGKLLHNALFFRLGMCRQSRGVFLLLVASCHLCFCCL